MVPHPHHTYPQPRHDREAGLAVGAGEAVHGQVSPLRRARSGGLLAAAASEVIAAAAPDPDLHDTRL